MRAYLVKDEGTLERLAKQKFQEDLNLKNERLSKGGVSSISMQSSSFGSSLSKGVQSFVKSQGT